MRSPEPLPTSTASRTKPAVGSIFTYRAFLQLTSFTFHKGGFCYLAFYNAQRNERNMPRRAQPDFRSELTGTDNNHKLTLEWIEEPDGSRALAFDAETWAAYEQAANAKGKTAHQIITTAVAGAFGPVLMDNYALNRFTRAGDQDFLRLNKKLKRQ